MIPILDPTRFVLMNTSHPGNVGAAARAIKVMGFGRLVLVQPRFADVLEREEAQAMASGATDVLVNAQLVDSLAEALNDVTHVCATAMTPRDFGPPTFAPRRHLPVLADAEERVAFVFGSERFGMANEDVWRCHSCLSVPTHPGYGSLNLAQAVQLVAYEWRQALGGFEVRERTKPQQAADTAMVDAALEHWRDTLERIGFLDPAAPRKLMPRLQQLIQRAQPTVEEIHILRGIARAAACGRAGPQ